MLAGLYTEICVAMPVLQALGERYDFQFVTDASGGVTVEGHGVAIQRMVQAGAVPVTWVVLAAELQRDWARSETQPAFGEMLAEHGGSIETAHVWEQQLLAAPTSGV